MTQRTLMSLIVGGLAAFFLTREQGHGTFAPLDQGHVAWLLANRPEPATLGAALTQAPSVIFARLNDVDHPEGERQFTAWPLTPLEWSGLLDELANLHPRTLVIPHANAWATQEPEPLLATSCQHLGPALLLETRAEATGTAPEAVAAQLKNITGDPLPVPQYGAVTGAEKLAPMGNFAISQVDLSENPAAKPSLTGAEFRLPLLFRQGEKLVPSVALAALAKQAAATWDQVHGTLGQSIRLPGRPEIPIDAAGGYTFHYQPINQQSLPSFNLDALKMEASLRERFLPQNDPLRTMLPAVERALVWGGEDDRESQRYSLPDGKSASLAELTARSLVAMQTGRNVAALSSSWQYAVLGAVLIYGLWMSRLTRSQLWKWAFCGVVLIAVASLLTFQSAGIWMPVGPALGVLFIIGIVNFLVPSGKVEVASV